VRLTYLLPLRRQVAVGTEDGLARYLRGLARHVDVVVVDGSAEPVRKRHASAFGSSVTLTAPAPEDRCANGKAWGVLTGLRSVATEGVVIADDDVRWDAAGLDRVASLLDSCALVIPQNYFTPMRWHAAWDTGRTLLNRAVWHDWPGTLALRASALRGSPAYDGRVLFENCEMVRTVRAWGGRVCVADDLFVARRPPSVRHFLGQRPRQAYDDTAQPARLAALLAVVPIALRGGLRAAAAGTGVCVALAELGRRRGGGARFFPWYASLCAPLWLCERALLVWWVAWRAVTRRGVEYSGVRIRRAATPQGVLIRRAAATRRQADSAAQMAGRDPSGRM